jgi:Ca2+-binding EF-hand superfamily protein
MTDNEMMRNKNCIREAFEFFDEDHTGYIERKELIDCLEGCEEEEVVKLIK